MCQREYFQAMVGHMQPQIWTRKTESQEQAGSLAVIGRATSAEAEAV